MSAPEFVAAAERADPTLKGEGKAAGEIQKLVGEVEGLAKDVPALDKRLTPLTFLHGNTASSADVGLYCHLHPTLSAAQSSAHPTHPSVTRYFMHVQSLPSVAAAQRELPNAYPPVDVDIASLPAPPRVVIDAKKEKAAKKAAKDAAGGVQAQAQGVLAQATQAAGAAAAAVQGAAAAAVGAVASATGLPGAGAEGASEQGKEGKPKKEKKEKPAKPAKVQPAKAEPAAPAPSMIDLRVGKVLDGELIVRTEVVVKQGETNDQVKKHPEADSLYVESIDVGEDEPRTVCSGLVKYMTEDQIRGATVIVVCNLKPVTMRGVKSFAMLLCASAPGGKDEGGIEFVLPPAGSKAGERVYFEGDKYASAQPETQLNPKKKVFETIQPDFTTLDNLEAAWVDPESKTVHRIVTKDGPCYAPSIKGASLS